MMRWASWRACVSSGRRRARARESLAPEATGHRADSVLADIESTHALLQAQRSATLVLQDRVAREVARSQDAPDRIDRFQAASLTRTFTHDTPPIWSAEPRGADTGQLHSVSVAFVASVAALRRFASDHAGRLVFHALLLAALMFTERAAGQRARSQAASGGEVLPAAALFDRPYSSRIVAALAAILWIYPDRLRLVGDVAIVVGLLPLLRIVRPLFGPALAPMLYGMSGLILVDRFRAELGVVPRADRILLMLEMLVVAAPA
jgi:hypothetical protein